MKHAGTPDPGDEFDAIYSGSASRVEQAGGTPLPNDTARTDDDDESKEDTNGRDT